MKTKLLDVKIETVKTKLSTLKIKTMKTKLLFIALCVSTFLNAQSIEFTSPELTEAEIGSTITVDFEYTISNDGYIYCAIELLDDFDYQDTVADAEINPAPAGTNVLRLF